ncbi:acyltransferase family protein [Variovorax ginsengisoli]|uniref:Acyltransferase family protein n=1 Tax=Variovorax ginsengisoli TaxID=363844 RepID=A0ABT8RZ89_9BURK|nr:acyltransferase family protein [Variovorax ginsengisoli]MDN8612814.1 acyltransferase family protein [Variovorax ginsengisoli]MDO1531984.1 acyltransferase family protein [Variovorax ginsengisoli]
MTSAHHRQTYLPEIDGLRALAVLSVVVFHAFPSALPGGFVGVDIFFVISGYLITSLLRAEWEAEATIDIVAFYARRARRILPMLVAVILATLGAVAVLLGSRVLYETAQSAAAALLFAANAYFQVTTGGYFDPATDKLPLLHLWSLGVEEQFYLVWPLALGLLLGRGRDNAVRWIKCAAFVSVLLAAVTCLLDPNAVFYLMPTRFWELAAGGLIALGAGGVARKPAAVAAAGLALMIVAISLPTSGLAAVNVVLGTVGAALLIWAVHARGVLGMVGQVLRSRPAVFFGLISYSLYLWHWPMLAIARNLHPGEVPAEMRAGLVVLAVALSWGSYRVIETPFRRPQASTPNRRLVGGSLAMCVSLSSLSWAVANAVEPPPQIAMNANPLAAATGEDYPRDSKRCRYIFSDKLDVFPKKGCGRQGDEPAVIVWGDSHAWAMGPFAAEVAKQEGTQWVSLSRDACPPALGYNVKPTRPIEAETCRKFNDLAAAQIRKTDTVVIVGHWEPYPNRTELLEGVARSVAQASATARRVILMGPSPTLRDTVPRCIEANNVEACSVPRVQFEWQTAEISEGMAAMARRFKNVTYVSRTDFFCTVDTCPAMKDGYSLYWDSHHPTSTAAKAFALGFLTTAQ